jgi:hypothetical protein
MPTIQFVASDADAAQIKLHAKAEDRTISAMVLRLVREALSARKEKA